MSDQMTTDMRNVIVNEDKNAGSASSNTLRIIEASPLGISFVRTSGKLANAVVSVQVSGLTSNQISGLSQIMISGNGATSATLASIQITGLSSVQIGGATSMELDVGVPVLATPINETFNFNPPLLGSPGATLGVQMSAFGSGNTAACITITGWIYPAT